jgi:hypothetical protein
MRARCDDLSVQPRTAILVVLGLATTVVVGPPATTAVARSFKLSADDYAATFCPGVFEFQIAAVDARDALAAASSVVAPDTPAARAQRAQLATAITVAARRSDSVARRFEHVRPHFAGGSAIVGTTVDAASTGGASLRGIARTLRRAPVTNPAKFAHTVTLAAKELDRKLVALGTAYDRVYRLDSRRAVRNSVTATRQCDTLGGKLGAAGSGTPTTIPPPATSSVTSLAEAHREPAVLLPGGRPPIAADVDIARRTGMSTRGRLLFYGSQPVVDGGAVFSSHCPTKESSFVVLGCYNLRTGRTFVLAVTRPELVGVVDTTAVHEMLHAAYARLSPTERARVDAMTSAYFATTTDPHLLEQMKGYDQTEPLSHGSELHSLLGSEIAPLTPELEAYYSQYFTDRQPVVAAYRAYTAVFDDLHQRRDAIGAQLGELKATLDSLDAGLRAASATASSLGAQIDALRAQGRISESNALVGPQNAAANQSRSLAAQYNSLIPRYNDLVQQYNALTVTGNDLVNALRPSG